MKTKFGVDIGNSTLYQKPYPAEFDLVSFPAGWCVPNFVVMIIEHLGSTLTNICYNWEKLVSMMLCAFTYFHYL